MAVLFTPQHYVLSRDVPNPPHWSRLFASNIIMFWAWAALTPAVMWFGRRFRLERPRIPRHLFYYFVAGFVLSFAHIVIVRYTSALIFTRPPTPWVNFLVAYGATGVLIGWGILAASQAVTYFRRYSDRELRLA